MLKPVICLPLCYNPKCSIHETRLLRIEASIKSSSARQDNGVTIDQWRRVEWDTCSMSSRKRKNSPISVSEENPSHKRAKLLSSLWVSQEEDKIETARKIQRHQSSSCSTGASTREKPKQYIVDWQNRHVTEGKYKSGRVRTASFSQNIIQRLIHFRFNIHALPDSELTTRLTVATKGKI